MSRPLIDYLPNRLMPRLPLVVAIAFMAYSLVLLGYFAVQWQRMRIETNAFLVADNQRRALAIGERVAALRTETQRHAESPEVSAYLINRDLGMSLRYGLGVNIQAIEDRFTASTLQANGMRPNRLVYLDEQQQTIADTAPDFPYPFETQGEEKSLVIDIRRDLLIIIVPVMHKGKRDGVIFALYSMETVYRNLLVSSTSKNYRELLLTVNGWPLSLDPTGNPLPPEHLRAITQIDENQVIPASRLPSATNDGALQDTLLIKTPIPGFPLLVATLVPGEQAHGHLASPGVLVAAGLIPLFLLLGATWLERLRATTVQLQAEKEAVELSRADIQARNTILNREISRREALENSLKEVTEQLKTIFALSPVGFVSLDRDNRIDYASPAFLHMAGFDEWRILGLDERALMLLLEKASSKAAPFPGFPHPPVSSQELGPGATASDTPEEQVVFELVAPTRRIVAAGRRASSIGHVSQLLYFRDITLESEIDRMKSEFLSTAAHELRTPMASVLGFSEVLLHSEFDAETQREFLSTIHRNSQLMAALINELLDLSRIEARRGKDFKFEISNLEALLKEVLTDFKPPDGRSMPTLRGSSALIDVRVDPRKLTQAINNVLSNAYKYSTPDSEVHIEVFQPEEEKADTKPTQIGIRIADQGIGMTDEQLSRIFERFYRADTSGKIPGTGLGMSIVKEIIELLGGSVTVESRYGHGTVVTLWLTAQRSYASADRAAASSTLNSGAGELT